MKKIFFFLFILFCLSGNISAQDTTSVATPLSEKFAPNPKKSAMMSLIVPGLGQIENHQGWKVPIIYGAFAGTAYLIYDNKKERNKWADYYRRKLEGEEIEGFNPNARPEAFKKQRDAYDKYYQLSIFGIAAIYLLQGVDAYVSAHLINFDINDDLTLQLNPGSKIDPSHGMISLSVQLR